MKSFASSPFLAGVLASVLVVAVLLPATQASANVWVFEPSASIDQRVDNNYLLELDDPDAAVSATRIIGNFGLSRDTPASEFRGLFRADGLLAINEDGTNDRSSNQLAYLESRILRPRSEFNTILSFKQDTPSRDISSDITDLGATAADTGASVTQDNNADRKRFIFNPTFSYNLSRRTELKFGYSFTAVSHEQLSCEEALMLDGYEPGPMDNGSGGTNVRPLTADIELDDFQEHATTISAIHQLSVIDRITFQAGYSMFETEEESLTPEFDEQTADPDCTNILRYPKENSTIETARFSIGYNRAVSPTLTLGGQLGYYVAESDKTRVLQNFSGIIRPGEIKETTGYLANFTVSKNTGITRYTGRAGIEVYPSDVGDLVESLELVGDMERKLSPLLDFTFRIRAYEPDTISDESDNDEFARRFLSLEPRLIWRFTRALTAATSYRYRRQKSQVATESAESHAVLFSLKYTPPSAIADARKKK